MYRQRWTELRWLLGVALVAGLLAACSASGPPASTGADTRTRTVDQVAMLRGPERQAVLEAGAREEGRLLWYTTLIVNQAVRPLIEGFTRKYPYIQVEHYRAEIGRAHV